MDPNLFHLDWMRTLEAVVGIIVLSFIVERVAALLFESRFFVHNTRVPDEGSEEARREHEGVAAARAIIAAAHAPDKVLDLRDGLGETNPLWPAEGEADAVARRAHQYLREMDARARRRRRLASLPIKEAVAFALAALICIQREFDAVAIILLAPTTTTWGAILTGAVIAGGSKASIKLFHDLLNVKSQAMREVRKPDDHAQARRNEP